MHVQARNSLSGLVWIRVMLPVPGRWAGGGTKRSERPRIVLGEIGGPEGDPAPFLFATPRPLVQLPVPQAALAAVGKLLWSISATRFLKSNQSYPMRGGWGALH